MSTLLLLFAVVVLAAGDHGRQRARPRCCYCCGRRSRCRGSWTSAGARRPCRWLRWRPYPRCCRGWRPRGRGYGRQRAPGAHVSAGVHVHAAVAAPAVGVFAVGVMDVRRHL
ncbi:hypothetical protein PF008_g29065 [Phytophthora fragariae]|uniref:Uncharacterized protein n=1 Tax=Phytophthora fragariae TaxID=53985 RepID=A0A6G0Q9I5_9STRA|nr:hypothetical protein PF008_g29065 [Phytophthora fragariae]